jgi:DNA-binding NarL/FixJ family response regulator
MTTFRMIAIDDDPLALDQLKAVMAQIRQPIDCEFFGSPTAALRAHIENPAALVLSDLRLGAVTGIDLINEMRQAAPNSVYMLLSGEADLHSALAALNHGGVFRFFLKPAERDSLEEGVVAAMAEANLKSLQSLSSNVLSTVDQLPFAVLNLDRSGRILFSNDRADLLLADRAHFDIGRERILRSISPTETKAFVNFLATAVDAAADGSVPVFRFNSPDRQTPLVLTVLGAPDDADEAIVALISDPTRKYLLSAAGISSALGVSMCEARVVHGLVEGGNLEDAARLAGVSVSTARSYIKTVFMKTGVSRQAELVRLALMSAA